MSRRVTKIVIPSTGGGGDGDVVGPAASDDNALARFDGTTGKLIKNSSATLSDGGDLDLPGLVNGRDVVLDGAALDAVVIQSQDTTDDLADHVADTANPHATTAAQVGAPPNARTITAGAGLTGGGDLSADRTVNVVANADGSIVVNANDVQVGVISDAQHGTRAGGTTHANVVAAGAAGFMTGADKTKLDGIAASAAALTSSAPVDVDTAAAVVGVAATAARADHKHDIATAAPGTILPDDAAAEGTATSVARSDHTHAIAAAAPVTVTGASNTEGSSSSFARADHQHALGVTIKNNNVLLGTNAVLDMVPGMNAFIGPGGSSIAIQAVGSSVAPVNVDKSAASAGTANAVSKVDHKHDVSTAVVGTILPDDTAAEGTATSLARSDHKHAIAAATAVDLTDSTSAEGTSSSFARADHTHSHGARAGGTLHANAVAAGAAGFMTGADKTKLDALPSTAPPTSRQIIAGAGLTGGGDLSADRTLDVVANADGSIVVAANDVKVGVINDAQHGTRSGGTSLHPNATASVSGFHSAADKTAWDLQVYANKTPGAYPYSALAADNVIYVDTASARTVNLPNPATYIYKSLSIVDAIGSAATNNITIARYGSEKINGLAANAVLNVAFGGATLVSNGTDWFVIAGSVSSVVLPTLTNKRADYQFRGGAPYSTQVSGAFSELFDQTANGLDFEQTSAAERPTLAATTPESADFSSSDVLVKKATRSWATQTGGSTSFTAWGVMILDSKSADDAIAPWSLPGPLGDSLGFIGMRFSASGGFGYLYDTLARVTPYTAISNGVLTAFRWSYSPTLMTVKMGGNTEQTIGVGAPASTGGDVRIGQIYTGGGGLSLDGRIFRLIMATSVADINTATETALSTYFQSAYPGCSAI